MRFFRADMHIHTVLSPCGDLEMSPANIITEATRKGLDIIGITDHNSTRHCSLVSKLAEQKGIFVLQGSEVTTKEEVHCLAFFENTDALNSFQEFLDTNLPDFPNDPAFFGDQVQVDEDENIIYEEKKLLINAIRKTIDEVEIYVHNLGGIFIPAHVDKMKNSIYSQLGFLPDNIKADALELSASVSTELFIKQHPEINNFSLTRSSDAHFPDMIGKAWTDMFIEEPTFREIKMALCRINGRKSVIK